MATGRRQVGELARLLRSRREELGLTRPGVQIRTEKFGPRSGVSAAYLEKIELGYQQRPSAAKLGVLAETYGLDIGKLLQLAGYVPHTRPPRSAEVLDVESAVRAMRTALGRVQVLTDDDRKVIWQHFQHIRRVRQRQARPGRTETRSRQSGG